MDQNASGNPFVDAVDPFLDIHAFHGTEGDVFSFAGTMGTQIRHQNIVTQTVVKESRKCGFTLRVTGIAVNSDHGFIRSAGIEHGF